MRFVSLDSAVFDVRLALLVGLFEDLNDVLITKLVMETDLLGVELHTAAPDTCEGEVLEQVSVNLHDGGLHVETLASKSQNEGVSQVGGETSSLGIDANETKLIPNFVHENVNAQLHMHGHAGVLGIGRKTVDVFNGNRVDFVVDVDALHILAVSLNCVY